MNDLLEKGDLVEIRSWRENNIRKVGVIVRPIKNSYVSDFSRYEVLVDNSLICIRRDMLQKIKKDLFRNGL